MGRQIFRFHIKHQGIYIFYTFFTIFLQFFYTFFTLFLHFFYNFFYTFFTNILQTRNTPAPTPPPLPLRPPRGSASSQPKLTLPQATGPLPPQPEGLVPNHGFPLVFQIPTCPDTKPGTHTFSQTLAPFLHAIETPLPTALITKCLLAAGSHGFGKRLDWNPTPGVRSSVN